MVETVAIDRPSATVSASALALHLDCSRAYIGKLEAEGVIQRQGDGFPLDQGRVAYLRYLRRERKQSPRGEANADFQAGEVRTDPAPHCREATAVDLAGRSDQHHGRNDRPCIDAHEWNGGTLRRSRSGLASED